MTDDPVVNGLRQLGDESFPETPSLSAAVLRGIAEPVPQRRHRFVFVAAIVAAVVLVAVALPAPRQALARWLGIGGVTLEPVAEYDLAESQLTDAPLGERVALTDVADLAGFDPLLPTIAGLGEPVAYVTGEVAGGLATFVYRNQDEGPGLVITQFRGVDEVAIKQIAEGATFREVSIGDDPAFWIEGTHTIAFLDDNGELRQDLARLVGNTLVWQTGDLTVRLETPLQLDEALEIAESIGTP